MKFNTVKKTLAIAHQNIQKGIVKRISFVFLIFIFIFCSCNEYKKNAFHSSIPDINIERVKGWHQYIVNPATCCQILPY